MAGRSDAAVPPSAAKTLSGLRRTYGCSLLRDVSTEPILPFPSKSTDPIAASTGAGGSAVSLPVHSNTSQPVPARWWDVCDRPWSGEEREKKRKAVITRRCKPTGCFGRRPRIIHGSGQTERRLPCFPRVHAAAGGVNSTECNSGGRETSVQA